MPDIFTQLAAWRFSDGYVSAVTKGMGGDFMGKGSQNALVTGGGVTRAFRGPLILEGLDGSQVSFNLDQSFGGLGSDAAPGMIEDSTLASGGTGYAVHDTGTVAGGTGATYRILTVSGGVVVTYEITNMGTGYEVDAGVATATGGGQPGAGSGFTIDIDAVSGVGHGSVFKVQDLLCYIGQGQVAFDGHYLAGIFASPILTCLKKTGSNYTPGPDAGPLPAGLVQATAPTIYAKAPPTAGQRLMNGAVSVVIWEICAITGQVSLMSVPSNVITLTNGSVIVQMPLPRNAFTTHWGIGVVKIGFADLGWYYQLPTSLGGETAEIDLTTIDGHARSIEISWTNGSLLDQDTAPDKAFPPPPGDLAGTMNDVAFLDAAGIIYVGEPGFIGSFAPDNALFASESAVTYLKVNDTVTARLGKTSIGMLVYVGGTPALEYQVVVQNQGIEFPQNAFIGANGRLCVWLGRPSVFDNNVEPDWEYANAVEPDFAGWESQTAEQPIAGGYDGVGRYECWFFGLMCLAHFVPSKQWCAPIFLEVGTGDNQVIGPVVDAVTVRHNLQICCSDGSTLVWYQFDRGSGSVMKIQTSHVSRLGYFSTVSLIMVEGEADNTAHRVTVETILNYDDDNPIEDNLSDFNATPSGVGPILLATRQPNVLNANQHAVRVTLTGQGGEAGVSMIRTFGANYEVLNNARPANTLAQEITFAPLTDKFVDDVPFLVEAFSTSGLSVAFGATGACTIVDHGNGTATVSLSGATGACHITASQPGDNDYDPATPVTQDFNVAKHPQTISFAALSWKHDTDGSFTVSATASSSLHPAFAAAGNCSVVDHGDGTATVTLTGVDGSCTITASQAGNSIFNAAPSVPRTFPVVPAADFLLTGLTPGPTLCTPADVFQMSADNTAVHIQKTAATPTAFDRGYLSNEVITNTGTVEFNFGPNNKCCSFGFASADAGFDGSCQELSAYTFFSGGTAKAFGVDFESIGTPDPTHIFVIGTDHSEAVSITTSPGDQFKITVNNPDVKVYQNGILRGTGVTDGRNLRLKASYGEPGSEVNITLFSTAVY